jgi:hypothetical protein
MENCPQVNPRPILVRQLRERAAKLDATEFMPAWRDLMEEAFPEIDAWYAENPIVGHTGPPTPWGVITPEILALLKIAAEHKDTLRGTLAQSIADTMLEREKEHQFYKKLRHNGLI